MTELTTTSVLHLADAAGREFGTLAVEEVQGDCYLGTFTPGADYPDIEPIFRHFAEVVEQQSFSYLDEVDAAIARLGIMARVPGGRAVPANDVQIYPDGGASLRLPTHAGRNGTT